MPRATSSRTCSRRLPAVAEKVAATLDAYAKEHGYVIVLDRDQQVPLVLYANESSDITKAIVEAYNVKSGIPAPEHSASVPAPDRKGTRLPRRAPPLPKHLLNNSDKSDQPHRKASHVRGLLIVTPCSFPCSLFPIPFPYSPVPSP